ncbi:hypothetical protein [Fortiea contorta]|uniref:hypothetical protein n=1 Tax=Fortiea contorta TaxID=1892405 RepID=UPI00034D6F36|nr:hypothetical protein [Fortiea contorta]
MFNERDLYLTPEGRKASQILQIGVSMWDRTISTPEAYVMLVEAGLCPPRSIRYF